MAYTDEEILEKREQRKREIHTTLEEGMYLGGEVVSFEEGTLRNIFHYASGFMGTNAGRVRKD